MIKIAFYVIYIFAAVAQDSIPGQGSDFPQASQCSQEKKKIGLEFQPN